MALVFGAATSDRVDCGSAAAIDDLAQLTVLAWFYPTTVTAGRRITTKESSTLGWQLNIRTGGAFGFIGRRATTDANAQSSSTPITVNTWHFTAGSWDKGAAAAPKLYYGNLTTIATEPGYSSQVTGTGANTSDATLSLMLGNRSNADQALQGRIATVAIFNRILTLEEIRSWQFRPRVMAGCLGLWQLGYAGTGTQPDWSGNANNGTVTGATVGDHVPLGPFFGYAATLPYVVAAAGGDLSVSKSETVTVSESVTLLVTSFVSISDSVTVTEARQLEVNSFVAASDSIAVTESVNLALAHQVNVSESVTITEARQLEVVSFIATSDSIAVTEAVTLLTTSFIAVSDSITVSESVSAAIVSAPAPVITVSDSIVVTESVTLRFDANVVVSDSVTVTESVSAAIVSAPAPTITVSDSITVTESVATAIQVSVTVNDTVTVSEAVALLVQSHITVNDTVTVIESVGVLVQSHVSVSDSISLTEIVSIIVSAPQIAVSDAITVSEAAFIDAGQFPTINRSETITVSELVTMIVVTMATSTSRTYSIGGEVRTYSINRENRTFSINRG